jgi:alpha-L-rhamnosidase
MHILHKLAFYLLFSLLFFHTHAQPWKGKWITAKENQNRPNTWIAFRKTVTIESKPGKLITRIAADSKYWLWINSKMVVFEGGLKRGPTRSDTYYDELDLAPHLQQGSNTIAVLLWYFGKEGFSHSSSGRAGLLFDCAQPDAGISSDSSWTATVLQSYQTAGKPLPNYRLPESSILFDGRMELAQWQSPSFTGAQFSNVSVIGDAGIEPWNKLVKRQIPLLKDFGLKKYISQQIRQGGRFDTIICKLPYNAQITPYIRVSGKEADTVTMFTDNYLIYNGGAAGIRAEYITRNGEQEYESLGWLNGHYVYYVLPKTLKPVELLYRESGYDTEFAGSFQCSDTFYNKLWEKSRRTLYITMRDSYMDCPDRERAQWTGDAVNESGEAFYALSTSSHALTKKWLYELVNWQRGDAVLYAPVPSGNWNSELPDQSLASVGYYGLWNYYLYTGDTQTIKDLYPGIRKYLDVWREDGKGMVEFRKGDWTWGDWGDNKDLGPMFNLWYYLAVKGMYNIAKELGYTEDAGEYAGFMNRFRTSFNKEYWNGTCYRDTAYKGRTDDRVQALAVVAGMADTGKYAALLKIFQTEEHASPYMEKYVFEAMMQMGYEEAALLRHKKRFSKMVNDPYFSTLFEGWGIGSDGFGGGTVNHAWSGGGLTILSQYVCGISPLEPGFGKIKILPQPGNIASASTAMESVKGTVRSGFQKRSSGLLVNVTIPPSTTAVIGIPGKSARAIRMNGSLVWKDGKYAEGIKSADITAVDKRIGFELSPGTWHFEVQY